MLSSHLRLGLPSGRLLHVFNQNLVRIYNISHACYVLHLSHRRQLDHPNNSW